MKRWLIVSAVMSATLMQVLDTTIVNVSLPYMEGSLGATPDQISWVLTSYLISSAIMMPLTGFISDRIGRRRYLLWSISGFVIASALCGIAESVRAMIAFRLLQGVCGSCLVPLSQAVMADTFPVHERSKAMAIWGTGVMVGPILGPTLGGYLTEIANWRWNFYINLPVGLIALCIVWRHMPESPKKDRAMDWMGLGFISTAIAGIQYVLDRGNQDDWFESRGIQIAGVFFIVGLLGFIWHSIGNSKSVFDLRIFKDRNFTIACLMVAVLGLGLYGSMVVQPLLLENLLNYPVLTTGLVMAPRGLSGMVGSILVAKMGHRISPRILIGIGMLCCVLGMSIGTYYNFDLDEKWFVFPLLLQGLGSGMIFVPLSMIAFSTLSPSLRAEAAGFYSLIRTQGSSIGISVAVTMLTRHTQMAWNQMSGFIHPYNPALTHYLNTLHLTVHDETAIALLTHELARQAQMVSFVNVFAFISINFCMMLPLLFLIKPCRPKNMEADLNQVME